MKGASPTNRAKLYQDLLRLDEGQLNSQSIRERIQLLLPALFKADPEMEAIEGMLSGFANAIKIPNGSIPDQSGFFFKVILGFRTGQRNHQWMNRLRMINPWRFKR